ncbi:nitrate- and nitrite sensing domain-containing protein [Dactylosporangium salmoneum]|uniref:histidine kinase n=1 Tax=Dactylosporangium salmoneum TaxID=53361 RepID=A0ABP5TRR7_9ACTN
MASRSSRLRTKITALLLSLTALWAFAAWVTLREGVNLLWVQTYNSQIYDPSEPLLLELQVERRMSVVYLGTTGAAPHGDLDAQRGKVDGLAAEFRQSAQSRWAKLAADAELKSRVATVLSSLDQLQATRTSVDSHTIDRAAASSAYTAAIESIFQVYYSLGKLDDQAIADDTVTLIQLNQVRELVSQEDALLAGALALGRFTDVEYGRFTQLVGAHRFLADQVAAKLPAADKSRYDAMVDGAELTRLRTIEDQVVSGSRTNLRLPVDAAGWKTTTEAAQKQILDVVLRGGDSVVQRATPVAIGVVVRLLLAAGLGLVTVIASIIVSITTARAILRQLERLRDAARHLATEQLPGVVARLSRGEVVDVATEAPPLEFGNDEIGQVGHAFNAVQETAIRAAVEQAELRRSVRDVFLSIARRSQSLIHRQLAVLDGMERRESDTVKLEDLFRVDHLATRMRRNAENLIVLAGSSPGRVWRRTVPMVDIVRGAIAEVEDYARVTVYPIAPVELAGRAVSDVIHLLAELVENALSFSPPHTEVYIKGQAVGTGYVLEVEDRGLGIGGEELTELNERIASHPEFNLASAARLGLFVVSRLAERHGIRVQLKESAYGGTTAIVLIPKSLLHGADAIEGGTGGAPAAGPRAAANRGANHREGTVEPLPASAHSSVALAEAPPPALEAAGPVTAVPPEPAPTPVADSSFTTSGLPVRMRQTSLAAPLRDESPDPQSVEPVAPAADPEQVRSRISSYQDGARRGRTDLPRHAVDDSAQPEA